MVTLVRSLEDFFKDQLNEGTLLHLLLACLFALARTKAGWPPELLRKLARLPASQHEMQMGCNYKARGCFLGFPLRGA